MLAITTISFLSLLNTALACCYLWDCSQRGKEVGQLELQDITLQNGESAIQSLLLSPRSCKEIIVELLCTKTIQETWQSTSNPGAGLLSNR